MLLRSQNVLARRIRVGWRSAIVIAALIGFAVLPRGESRVAAQDVDPFGAPQDQPAAAPAPAAARAVRPAGEPAAPAETDILVLDLRKSNPTTPQELMRAVRVMTDYGRLDEANRYLKRLSDAQPEDVVLVELHTRYGSGPFVNWIHDPRFAPVGPVLGRRILEVATKAAEEPQRLRNLVTQLSDPVAEIRRAAVVDLGMAGTAAMAPLLEVLADPQRDAEHPVVVRTLVQLGPMVVGPLLGALETPDAAQRVHVIEALRQLQANSATKFLVRSAVDDNLPEDVRRAAAGFLHSVAGGVPTKSQAERYLFRRAQSYYAGDLVSSGDALGNADHEDQLTIWTWDPETKTPVARRMPQILASRAIATRLAVDLYALNRDSREHRRLYLHTVLDSTKHDAGLDEPLPESPLVRQLSELETAVLEDALESAIEAERYVAAVGLAELLGRSGDKELLRSPSGRPRALTRAARHADRRLRAAATDAILTIDPEQPYPGSSFVAESLAFLTANVGTRRAVVAHPRGEQLQTLVGLLNNIGLDADAANTGRQAFQLAVSRSDYEFILLSDAVDYPPVAELIQSLRADARTAELPIGIMARDENFERMTRLAEQESLTIVLPRPTELETVALVAHQLSVLPGSRVVPRDARIKQARMALGHMARLASQPQRYAYYDFYRFQRELEIALFTDELSPLASEVLGHLGSAAAQRALLLVVHRESAPLAEREAALSAFTQAVAKRGILLTKPEILAEYDKYNRSATADESVQRLLGGVLDAMEARLKKNGTRNDDVQPQSAQPN